MKIKEVLYRVTTDFGDSAIGSFRSAYLVGGDDQYNGVLLFHPREKSSYCASIEFCKIRPRGTQTLHGHKVFVSVGKESYVNLTNDQEKEYMRMIMEAGLPLRKTYDVPDPKFFTPGKIAPAASPTKPAPKKLKK